ncbi:C40 family peptidase [Sphingobacterium composti Ten et al. 2007 non Yoo et al. 2007]|uniref:C40 family peptidase n=1 Tax=Sphingobacterium composti TaxID=363260 RepID=UPI001F3879CC|nr:C40 family peptidase [Sphingobacterium composti Ten et al. 2007 non Yoo et al. 2007]
MKNTFTYFCLPFAICLGSMKFTNAQTDSTIYKSILQTIESNKPKYAPDKRTKLLELVNVDIINNKYTIQTTEKEVVPVLKQELQKFEPFVNYQLLPDTSVQDKKQGIIQLSVANLRSKPGHSEELATQVLLGTKVDLLQKIRSDYRVRTPEGYIAWVPTSSVTAMDSSSYVAWQKTPKIIYTNEFGKSYSKPDQKSIRVSDLVYGNILSLSKEHKKFYEVEYPDGRIAFIPKEEAVTFDKWLHNRDLTAENIIQSAKSMMGLPYLWGGTSVKGVDCSGFTKTSFYMNGYVIPRDASQQVLAGDEVQILDENGKFSEELALKNLKPADLLFFAGGRSSRITHVALYIGNGEFIHSAGTVRINSMLKNAPNYDDFQTRTLVSAKRYIGSKDPQIKNIKEHTAYSN